MDESNLTPEQVDQSLVAWPPFGWRIVLTTTDQDPIREIELLSIGTVKGSDVRPANYSDFVLVFDGQPVFLDQMTLVEPVGDDWGRFRPTFIESDIWIVPPEVFVQVPDDNLLVRECSFEVSDGSSECDAIARSVPCCDFKHGESI